MISTDLLIRFTGVEPETFGFKDQEELEGFLNEIISMASDMIREYTGQVFPEAVPSIVQNCCLRLAGNIIAQAIARQDIELLRSGDYSNELLRSDVFTKDIKDDLKQFIQSDSTGSGTPRFYTITGDEE